MTPTQLSELQTAVAEAIETSNTAISKLCHIAYLLKDIRFKTLLETIQVGEKVTTPQSSFTPAKKKSGDPLSELQHNLQQLSPAQLSLITAKLSQPETVIPNPVTDTKEST